jgi:recombination protein RecR
MAAKLPVALQTLIDTLSRLPGIGPKMASRLAFHLLRQSEYELVRFISALDGIRTGLSDCTRCGHISEAELCSICRDETRNVQIICVVEEPLDVIALERAGSYHGVYHVLGGALSPIDGVGPEQLRIRQLVARVQAATESSELPLEIILATNPSLEGEATATYVQQQLVQLPGAAKLNLSRIARGLPMGSDLEYADPATLLRALEGRRSLQ